MVKPCCGKHLFQCLKTFHNEHKNFNDLMSIFFLRHIRLYSITDKKQELNASENKTQISLRMYVFAVFTVL